MIWKPIMGFEQYEISDTGLVRKGIKIIKPFDNSGYDRVFLTNRNGTVKKLIHRIVAEHFIPTDDVSLQVNHKNMDKKSNYVENLEWVTCKENVQHALKHDPSIRKRLKEDMSRIGKKYGKQNAMKTRKPVNQLTLDGKFIQRYESARDASRATGAAYKNVSQCCNGKRKSHKGFKWQFANVQSPSTIESTSYDGSE